MSEDSNEKIELDKTEKELPSIPQQNLTKKLRQRLRQVRQLYFIRGWGKDEIAEALKVSPKTVDRDIKYIKDYGKTLAQKDMEYRNDALNFLWELNDNYRERIKHLWNDYKPSTQESVKVEILKELRQQEKQYFEFLQSMGIMPKEAEKFMHGIVYVSHLKEKTIEEKKDEKQIESVVSSSTTLALQ